MSITHTILNQWANGNNILNGTVTTVSDNESNDSSTYPITATDYVRAVGIPTQGGRLKSIYMLSTTDLTVKTNTTVGVDTIVLKANVPWVWTVSWGAVPFTADITSLRLTGTNPAAGQFDMRALYSA